ncbi:TauD/TfdA family dioxygenase [Desertimonas flava]|uniref:TauD/TfdA family dioxygenase n=1 Tax=Desertimonas flava TaxID=2064846 RepID=UPI000E340A1A|nr:TauD/TfdA family dioxygenase [Desertimonas flava]
MIDVRAANLIPSRATTPAQARGLVALDGAAVVSGITTVEDAVAFGSAMLAGRVLRIAPQFEATKAAGDESAAVVAEQPVDARGRKRHLGSYDKTQPAHNDGYGFGDFAPDHMFLWCDKPCSIGGASFLVDALKLATILSAEDTQLADFLWDEPIDHSEPNFPQGEPAPIARFSSGGRAQVRSHPYQLPRLGPDETDHYPFVERWGLAVAEARSTGPRFRLEAGQLLCIDNYRMLHGREAYVDTDRKVVSIWAWTTGAVKIPAGQLDIVTPYVPEPVR